MHTWFEISLAKCAMPPQTSTDLPVGWRCSAIVIIFGASITRNISVALAEDDAQRLQQRTTTLSDAKKKMPALLCPLITLWPGVAFIIAPLTDRNGTSFVASKQSKLAGAWSHPLEAFDPDKAETHFLDFHKLSLREHAGLRQERSPNDWRSIMGKHYGDKHALALYVTANPIPFASSLYDGVTPL